jgi:signal transduction histidine kinase
MEPLALPFFPFPYVIGGERHSGHRFSWPDRCNHCDRQCERMPKREISLCSYGVNYIWLTPDLLVFGFLLNAGALSSAQKKVIRAAPDHVVTANEIDAAAEVYTAAIKAFEDDVKKRKSAIIEEYVKHRRYENDFLESLRPEIQKSFSFVHDYKQFIARIRQNINVVIEDRYRGGELDAKLDRAHPAEAAIYWASMLMEEKLRTAFFLLNPDQITDKLTLFRLHGLVLKTVRIYNAAFREKGVNLQVFGESNGDVRGNSMAVSVIPHTLIDNALKYSKRGSEVQIEFRETATEIEFRVSSYGSEISADETDKIFELFYRGRSARQQEEEGAGFGLYLAQFIAMKMGTKIDVWQDPSKAKFGFKTTFSVRFRRDR